MPKLKQFAGMCAKVVQQVVAPRAQAQANFIINNLIDKWARWPTAKAQQKFMPDIDAKVLVQMLKISRGPIGPAPQVP